MRAISGNQDSLEFSQFLDFINQNGIKRYCEIGCRNGDTFYWVARTIGPDGLCVAVDLPENNNSRLNLLDTISELVYTHKHKNTYFYLDNSHNAMTIRWVRERGPFDLILIDADHRYSGVTRDYICYHHMTKFIAFHDIDAPDGHFSDGHFNGVGRFWREVKPKHKVAAEIINPGSQMGFGILEL